MENQSYQSGTHAPAHTTIMDLPSPAANSLRLIGSAQLRGNYVLNVKTSIICGWVRQNVDVQFLNIVAAHVLLIWISMNSAVLGCIHLDRRPRVPDLHMLVLISYKAENLLDDRLAQPGCQQFIFQDFR